MEQEPLELAWQVVNSKGFANALFKLYNKSGLEAKTAYRISRIFHGCEEVCREVYEKELTLRKKHAIYEGETVKVNSSGEPEVDPAKKEVFDAAYKEICPSFIKIKVLKIDFAEIMGAGLTPQDLHELTPLIENIPD